MNKAVPPSELVPAPLLLVFSHLRWDFVVQRPHHLLNRASKSYRVVYFEEPEFRDIPMCRLDIRSTSSGVKIATPVLPHGFPDHVGALRDMVDRIVNATPNEELITWYYTPMALAFSDHLRPDLCVYDCMDELAAFKNPPPGLLEREEALFRPGRHRLHRRTQPLRGQARPPFERLLLSLEH